MTWTPADGPSRETLLNDPFYASTDDMNDLRLIALAAHDLYEEVQTLKAKPAGQALDEIREVVQLREANERLRKTWEVEADSHAANVAELRAKLAEAKRDTERLDWLEEAVPSGRLRQAAEDMTTCSGTVRSLIDGLRRMPPTPERMG